VRDASGWAPESRAVDSGAHEGSTLVARVKHGGASRGLDDAGTGAGHDATIGRGVARLLQLFFF